MFEKIYEIKYSDSDENLRLKPQVLLKFMEDIAAKNANYMGIGYDSLYPQDIGWFLLKYTINFENYPKNIYSIKLATESRGINKIFAYRDFYFWDNNDNLIGRATSTWALIDLNNKSLLNPIDVLGERISKFEKKPDDLKYNKIPTITNITNEKIFEVRFDDIDVNRHVNNTIYLLWAMESLPIDVLNNKTIKTLDIVYKKELLFGNTAIVQSYTDEATSIMEIKNKNNNEDLANILISWN